MYVCIYVYIYIYVLGAVRLESGVEQVLVTLTRLVHASYTPLIRCGATVIVRAASACHAAQPTNASTKRLYMYMYIYMYIYIYTYIF